MDRFNRCRTGGSFAWIYSFLSLAALVAPTPGHAIGDVTVTPTRVVFEGHERKARVTLVNRGDSPQTYRISWSHKRMAEDGGYETIENALPGEKFSDAMIRYAPRQVVLPPGKPQTVRLMLRKPANLEAGEYRSYLTFTALPSAGSKSITQKIGGKDGIGIELTPVVSISIPVIVRQGELSAQATLSDIELKHGADGSPRLTMTFERSGDRSLHGDLIAEYRRHSGTPIVVGRALALSLFPPATQRRFELPLQLPTGVALKNGELTLRYLERNARGATDKVLAQATLSLP